MVYGLSPRGIIGMRPKPCGSGGPSEAAAEAPHATARLTATVGNGNPVALDAIAQKHAKTGLVTISDG
jgi:hypothetical protein